jgi:Domain of unknown function (DUF6895)
MSATPTCRVPDQELWADNNALVSGLPKALEASIAECAAQLADALQVEASTASTSPNDRAEGRPLDRRRLSRRLDHTLRFAEANIARLDQHATIWADPHDPFVTLVDKIVVESALLARVAARAPASSLCEHQIAVLCALLVPRARSERNRVLLMRFPHTALSLGLAHVALTELGYPDEEFSELLDRAITSGYADSVERLPYREMEWRWFEGMLHGRPPTCGDLLPHSILGSDVHPLYMLGADVYALTHAVMFLTDFGRWPLVGPDLNALQQTVDASIAWMLDAGNLDLLAELVMTASMVEPAWSPYVAAGWACLEAAWSSLDCLPGPGFEPEVFSQLEEADRSAYAFRHTYHTTYVGGMLCALLLAGELPTLRARHPMHAAPAAVVEDLERCVVAARQFSLQSERSSPRPAATSSGRKRSGVSASGRPGSTGDVESFTARALVAAPEIGAWARAGIAQFESGVSLEGDSGSLEIARVATDAALVSAGRGYDLSRLADALAVAAGLPGPPSSTVIEAGRFLARQQHPSGAIGAHFLIEENRHSPAGRAVTGALADAVAAAAAAGRTYQGGDDERAMKSANQA